MSRENGKLCAIKTSKQCGMFHGMSSGPWVLGMSSKKSDLAGSSRNSLLLWVISLVQYNCFIMVCYFLFYKKKWISSTYLLTIFKPSAKTKYVIKKFSVLRVRDIFINLFHWRFKYFYLFFPSKLKVKLENSLSVLPLFLPLKHVGIE